MICRPTLIPRSNQRTAGICDDCDYSDVVIGTTALSRRAIERDHDEFARRAS